MNVKWIGAICIIVGCGGCGLSAANAGRRETRMLRELLRTIQLMECELQYNLTPLPDLCRQAGMNSSGTVREVFANLARELDWQTEPDARSCMAQALEKSHTMTRRLRQLFLQLGDSLGRFDFSGQMKELQHLHAACEAELHNTIYHQESRLRTYQTLGFCAGIALAILFL